MRRARPQLGRGGVEQQHVNSDSKTEQEQLGFDKPSAANVPTGSHTRSHARPNRAGARGSCSGVPAAGVRAGHAVLRDTLELLEGRAPGMIALHRALFINTAVLTGVLVVLAVATATHSVSGIHPRWEPYSEVPEAELAIEFGVAGARGLYMRTTMVALGTVCAFFFAGFQAIGFSLALRDIRRQDHVTPPLAWHTARMPEWLDERRNGKQATQGYGGAQASTAKGGASMSSFAARVVSSVVHRGEEHAKGARVRARVAPVRTADTPTGQSDGLHHHPMDAGSGSTYGSHTYSSASASTLSLESALHTFEVSGTYSDSNTDARTVCAALQRGQTFARVAGKRVWRNWALVWAWLSASPSMVLSVPLRTSAMMSLLVASGLLERGLYCFNLAPTLYRGVKNAKGSPQFVVISLPLVLASFDVFFIEATMLLLQGPQRVTPWHVRALLRLAVFGLYSAVFTIGAPVTSVFFAGSLSAVAVTSITLLLCRGCQKESSRKDSSVSEPPSHETAAYAGVSDGCEDMSGSDLQFGDGGDADGRASDATSAACDRVHLQASRVPGLGPQDGAAVCSTADKAASLACIEPKASVDRVDGVDQRHGEGGETAAARTSATCHEQNICPAPLRVPINTAAASSCLIASPRPATRLSEHGSTYGTHDRSTEPGLAARSVRTSAPVLQTSLAYASQARLHGTVDRAASDVCASSDGVGPAAKSVGALDSAGRAPQPSLLPFRRDTGAPLPATAPDTSMDSQGSSGMTLDPENIANRSCPTSVRLPQGGAATASLLEDDARTDAPLLAALTAECAFTEARLVHLGRMCLALWCSLTLLHVTLHTLKMGSVLSASMLLDLDASIVAAKGTTLPLFALISMLIIHQRAHSRASDLQRTALERRRAEQMRRFFRYLCHELRSPLNAVLLASEEVRALVADVDQIIAEAAAPVGVDQGKGNPNTTRRAGMNDIYCGDFREDGHAVVRAGSDGSDSIQDMSDAAGDSAVTSKSRDSPVRQGCVPSALDSHACARTPTRAVTSSIIRTPSHCTCTLYPCARSTSEINTRRTHSDSSTSHAQGRAGELPVGSAADTQSMYPSSPTAIGHDSSHLLSTRPSMVGLTPKLTVTIQPFSAQAHAHLGTVPGQCSCSPAPAQAQRALSARCPAPLLRDSQSAGSALTAWKRVSADAVNALADIDSATSTAAHLLDNVLTLDAIRDNEPHAEQQYIFAPGLLVEAALRSVAPTVEPRCRGATVELHFSHTVRVPRWTHAHGVPGHTRQSTVRRPTQAVPHDNRQLPTQHLQQPRASRLHALLHREHKKAQHGSAHALAAQDVETPAAPGHSNSRQRGLMKGAQNARAMVVLGSSAADCDEQPRSVSRRRRFGASRGGGVVNSETDTQVLRGTTLLQVKWESASGQVEEPCQRIHSPQQLSGIRCVITVRGTRSRAHPAIPLHVRPAHTDPMQRPSPPRVAAERRSASEATRPRPPASPPTPLVVGSAQSLLRVVQALAHNAFSYGLRRGARLDSNHAERNFPSDHPSGATTSAAAAHLCDPGLGPAGSTPGCACSRSSGSSIGHTEQTGTSLEKVVQPDAATAEGAGAALARGKQNATRVHAAFNPRTPAVIEANPKASHPEALPKTTAQAMLMEHRSMTSATHAPSIFVSTQTLRGVMWRPEQHQEHAVVALPPSLASISSDPGPHTLLMIQIHDRGAGIDPRDLPKLFSGFQMIRAAHHVKGNTTGLDLAIASAIVRRLGGVIGAWSEGEGLGACFWLCVPVREATAGDMQAIPSLSTSADLGKLMRSGALGRARPEPHQAHSQWSSCQAPAGPGLADRLAVMMEETDSDVDLSRQEEEERHATARTRVHDQDGAHSLGCPVPFTPAAGLSFDLSPMLDARCAGSTAPTTRSPSAPTIVAHLQPVPHIDATRRSPLTTMGLSCLSPNVPEGRSVSLRAQRAPAQVNRSASRPPHHASNARPTLALHGSLAPPSRSEASVTQQGPQSPSRSLARALASHREIDPGVPSSSVPGTIPSLRLRPVNELLGRRPRRAWRAAVLAGADGMVHAESASSTQGCAIIRDVSSGNVSADRSHSRRRRDQVHAASPPDPRAAGAIHRAGPRPLAQRFASGGGHGVVLLRRHSDWGAVRAPGSPEFTEDGALEPCVAAGSLAGQAACHRDHPGNPNSQHEGDGIGLGVTERDRQGGAGVALRSVARADVKANHVPLLTPSPAARAPEDKHVHIQSNKAYLQPPAPPGARATALAGPPSRTQASDSDGSKSDRTTATPPQPPSLRGPSTTDTLAQVAVPPCTCAGVDSIEQGVGGAGQLTCAPQQHPPAAEEGRAPRLEAEGDAASLRQRPNAIDVPATSTATHVRELHGLPPRAALAGDAGGRVSPSQHDSPLDLQYASGIGAAPVQGAKSGALPLPSPFASSANHTTHPLCFAATTDSFSALSPPRGRLLVCDSPEPAHWRLPPSLVQPARAGMTHYDTLHASSEVTSTARSIASAESTTGPVRRAPAPAGRACVLPEHLADRRHALLSSGSTGQPHNHSGPVARRLKAAQAGERVGAARPAGDTNELAPSEPGRGLSLSTFTQPPSRTLSGPGSSSGPVSPRSQASDSAGSSSTPHRAGGGLTWLACALVVDDVESNKRLLARLLKRQGVKHVLEARDGEHALNELCLHCGIRDLRCKDQSPSCDPKPLHNAHNVVQAILTDKEMPVMDGYVFASTLRALGYQGVVLGVTGNALPRDVQAFMSHGVQEVLLKPVGATQIVRAITEHTLSSTLLRTTVASADSGGEDSA